MPQERRLAAILVADVVGFSRLVGADETGTLARLEALRHEITDPLIASHGGRLFKQTGDGFLVEFGSAVQAVICARAIQEKADGGPLRLRIGIHLGDVVVQGDDLLGDGVNIAARLEGVAPPGGIALSRQVHDQVRDRIAAPFEDRGEVPLKNIARPVHVFALGSGKAPEDMEPAALALPDKPSIAVLPFQNMSGDPEQEYFADGIVEDILTALTRFKALFVIARNSSFTYKGRTVDIKQVGRELGVRYVLEGSVRKAGGRIRVTAQLIDAADGRHVWAERFDRMLEDIFAVQEEITGSIVGAIAPEIEASEITRTCRSTSIGAHDKAMMAVSHYRHFLATGDQSSADEALREARSALAIDPKNLRALDVVSTTRIHQVIMGWTDEFDVAWNAGIQAAERAIEAERHDSEGYRAKGTLLIYAKGVDRIDEALINLRRAHVLNPHNVHVLFALALGEICAGDPKGTITHAGEALRLSPRDPLGHALHLMISMAHFCLGNYSDGVAAARLGISESEANASLHAHLAINHMGLGQHAEAAAAAAEMHRVSPAFATRALAGKMQYRNPEYLHRATTFLRLAAGVDKPNEARHSALALPDKPSIAVLPFQNMSGDPEQEYFADGIVEDIITALSRFKSLFVIARNSSFVYKGRAIDIKQVGRELGVRYVLEGSVRKSGGRVRITGQLIEAATGAHLWADRFDSALEDIFDLQDRVAASVAGTVGTRLEEVEIEHARRRPPNSLDAYDCFLRGQAVFRLRTRQALDEAHLMFERAIELDPDFSTPYGLAARCYSTQRLHGWIDDVDRATSDVRRYAKAVSRAGQDDALAQSWLAFALMWVCADHVGGETFIDRALAINPNLAVAWQVKGWISQQLGDHERSREEFGRATRLSPIGPDFHLVQGYGALSLFLLERDATALRQATHALNHLPSWPVGPLVCAALHGLVGNRPEARSCIARLGDLMPGLTLSTMSDLFIFRQHKDLERLRSGLRLAGLPE